MLGARCSTSASQLRTAAEVSALPPSLVGGPSVHHLRPTPPHRTDDSSRQRADAAGVRPLRVPARGPDAQGPGRTRMDHERTRGPTQSFDESGRRGNMAFDSLPLPAVGDGAEAPCGAHRSSRRQRQSASPESILRCCSQTRRQQSARRCHRDASRVLTPAQPRRLRSAAGCWTSGL